MSQTKYPRYLSHKTCKWLDERETPGDQDGVNAYRCRVCEKTLFTRDIDHGVTPALLKCQECGGAMTSAFYHVPQKAGMATNEFYRPDDAEFARLGRGLQLYCRQGGLLLREIER